MKKLVSGLSVCMLAFTSFVPVAYTETVQEKCDRLEREGEKLPPECMKIPVPENPNPAPQPSVKPTPAEEEPPHEAWESPNAGGEDSGSAKPEKPEKPVKPAKPEKDPKPSGSKKPSGSSSGDKNQRVLHQMVMECLLMVVGGPILCVLVNSVTLKTL